MKRMAFLLLGILAFFSCADLKRAELLYLQGRVKEASKELKELADRDFPKANYLLGKIALEKGDSKSALFYFKKAYKLGYPPAAKEIGSIYLNLGNKEKALTWFKLAAKRGDIKAYLLIGDCYYSCGNFERALEYYRKAYINGFLKAGFKIASAYLSLGKKEKAVKVYEELYAKGENRAAYELGKLYEEEAKSLERGFCPIANAKTAEEYIRLRRKVEEKMEKALRRAVKWYRRAGNYPPAQYRLARLKWFISGNKCGDYEVMLKFAKEGVKEAYNDLVRLYAGGKCQAPENITEEINSLKKTFAFEGIEEPAIVLKEDEWFQKGKELLTVNPEKAKVYLEKSCKAGNVSAEVELANLIKEKNPSLAEAVFLFHAKRGNTKAAFSLAKLYFEYGRKDMAVKVYEELYAKGENRAAYELGKLYEEEAKSLERGFCPIANAKTAEEYIRLRRKVEEKMEKALRRAVKWYRRAGNYPPAQYRLARLKWFISGNKCGDYEVMLKFAKEGVKEAYNDLVRLYAGGKCQAPENITEEINSLKKTFAFEGIEEPAIVLKEDEWFQKGKELLTVNPEKAKVYLEKSCKAGNVSAEVELANLIKEKNPSLAEAVFLFHAKRGNPKAMFLLAQMYIKEGLKDEGIFWLEKAATLGYRPAIIYMLNYGSVQRALELLEKLKDTYPCFYHLVMSKVYEEGLGTGPDLRKSIEHLKLAEKKGCLEAILRLAQVYFSCGEYRRALEYAERYLRYNENYKTLTFVAKIYIKLGNTDKAAEYLLKAVENGYILQVGDLEFLFSKFKDRKLRKLELSNNLLIFLADKLADRNFKASLCYAYKAALSKTPGAAIFILKLGTRIYTQEQASFLKAVSEDPSVCDRYVKILEGRLRRGNFTLNSLVEYLASVDSTKKR